MVIGEGETKQERIEWYEEVVLEPVPSNADGNACHGTCPGGRDPA